MTVSRADLIITDALNRASVRIHWAIFIHIALSAIILINIFSRNYSYEESLARAAAIFVLEMEGKLSFLEKKYEGWDIVIKKPNGSTVQLKQINSWKKEDFQNYSSNLARQQRAINVINEYKFSAAQLPYLGVNISASDLEVILGVAIILLLLWIFSSTSKALLILNDEKSKRILSEYSWAVKHLFLTIHSPSILMSLVINFIAFFIGPFAIFLAIRDNHQVKDRLLGELYYTNELMKSIDNILEFETYIFCIAVALSILTFLAGMRLYSKLHEYDK